MTDLDPTDRRTPMTNDQTDPMRPAGQVRTRAIGVDDPFAELVPLTPADVLAAGPDVRNYSRTYAVLEQLVKDLEERHPGLLAGAPVDADLSEELARVMEPVIFAGRPDEEVGSGTRSARRSARRKAGAALQWFSARPPALTTTTEEVQVAVAAADASAGVRTDRTRRGMPLHMERRGMTGWRQAFLATLGVRWVR